MINRYLVGLLHNRWHAAIVPFFRLAMRKRERYLHAANLIEAWKNEPENYNPPIDERQNMKTPTAAPEMLTLAEQSYAIATEVLEVANEDHASLFKGYMYGFMMGSLLYQSIAENGSENTSRKTREILKKVTKEKICDA